MLSDISSHFLQTLHVSGHIALMQYASNPLAPQNMFAFHAHWESSDTNLRLCLHSNVLYQRWHFLKIFNSTLFVPVFQTLGRRGVECATHHELDGLKEKHPYVGTQGVNKQE